MGFHVPSAVPVRSFPLMQSTSTSGTQSKSRVPQKLLPSNSHSSELAKQGPDKEGRRGTFYGRTL